MVTDLAAIIAEAFENASENGYDLYTWTVEDIAGDLLAYHSEIENLEREEVEHAVDRHLTMKKILRGK